MFERRYVSSACDRLEPIARVDGCLHRNMFQRPRTALEATLAAIPRTRSRSRFVFILSCYKPLSLSRSLALPPSASASVTVAVSRRRRRLDIGYERIALLSLREISKDTLIIVSSSILPLIGRLSWNNSRRLPSPPLATRFETEEN